jgi:hypothetical protein
MHPETERYVQGRGGAPGTAIAADGFVIELTDSDDAPPGG